MCREQIWVSRCVRRCVGAAVCHTGGAAPRTGGGHAKRMPLRGLGFKGRDGGQAYLDRWEPRWTLGSRTEFGACEP